MLTVFVYARLWRRAGVMTDVEFAELRYAGKPAAFLRGFRALYLGIPINCIIIGWVNLAMVKILQVTLGLDADRALLGPAGDAGVHRRSTPTIAGLWGVLVTDLVQFVLKMGMVWRWRIFAVRATGGLGGAARTKVRRSTPRPARGSRLAFFPSTDSALDAGDHLVRLSRRELVGELVSRAPSLAAAATSLSASSRRRTSGTACLRRSGSTSPTTRCGRGRGS